MPYFERAIDPPGFSGVVGLAGNVVYVPSIAGEGTEAAAVLDPVVTVHYCPVKYASVGIGGQYQLMYSANQSPPVISAAAPFLGASAKGMLGKAALRLWFGWKYDRTSRRLIPKGQADFLFDFSNSVTGAAGVFAEADSPWPFLKAGVTFHPHLSEHLTGHVTFADAEVFSGEAGFGLEWHQHPYQSVRH